MKKRLIILGLLLIILVFAGCQLIDQFMPKESVEVVTIEEEPDVKEIESEIFEELENMELKESYVSLEDDELTP